MASLPSVSKLEYLKRYMTSDDNSSKKSAKDGKKKKLKVFRSQVNNVKIFDVDIKFKDSGNLGSHESGWQDFENDYEVEEDKPMIFAEDGVTLLKKDFEENKTGKWAPISSGNFQGNEIREIKTSRPSQVNKKNNKITKQRHDDSPDLSPQRPGPREPKIKTNLNTYSRSRKQNSSRLSVSPDISPPRKQRHDSPDSSPRYVHGVSPSNSKVKRYRDVSPDISPPRRRRHDSPDLSPSRGRRHDSPDLSPSRGRRHDSPDLSPSRGRRHDSPDLSPPRKQTGNLLSSVQKRLSPDLSPPRKRNKEGHKSTSNNYEISDKIQQRKITRREKSPEIITTGLQSAATLRKESDLKRKQEDQLFRAMDASVSGRGTETVYRDKTGKKIDLKQEKIKKREEEDKKAQEDEKFMKWGKGIKQAEDYQKKLKEDLHEINKPLARYKDDKDLDSLLKEQDRSDDPMLAYMQKKKEKKGNDAKEILPRYKGPLPPPNRFNIWPGYRWDGVDRSNGFEKKRFGVMSEKKTLAQEAYKWSIEDM